MNPNRYLRTVEVVEKIRQSRPDIEKNCYVVGCWVWAEFEEKPSKETREFLIELGFSWNSTRKVWQHACGIFRRHTSGDPRKAYGVEQLQEVA